ncbi:unnamed protein product [Closterium sp. NIES-64]|nr:unnamed protein product [Closterium sp. NIES-64]
MPQEREASSISGSTWVGSRLITCIQAFVPFSFLSPPHHSNHTHFPPSSSLFMRRGKSLMTTTPTTLISRPSPLLLNVKVPMWTSSRPLPLPATPTTLPTTPPTCISRPPPPSLYEGSTWTSSRPHTGQGIDDITSEMLEDCAQLVKANSIMCGCRAVGSANKLNNIDVVYTPWANL